ncbi:hypothetical protein [Chitinophaga sp. LS1]|uniref:hypothetical protein n=1 Tax=Chitinophaga sp. LS1 TaxID=3051176 RepID=UPI002AAAC87E|nr:hypothetical protein [Chitinophaga sp. LS1]WPV65726.1 hypothetical protein QQL36_28400 [Chitinophaga sp. LS1]
MAWNKYYVFVKGAYDKDLLLKDFESGQEVNLFETNKPETLFAGEYNDCLILVDKELPFEFLSAGLGVQAKAMIDIFPEAEIGVLLENSTVGVYGYAVFKEGTRIRTKYGSEEEVYFEFGNPLLEEQEAPDEPLFEEEELEEMEEDGLSRHEIREMVRFAKDFRVPGKLVKRFLGIGFHELNPAEVKLTRYKRKASTNKN